MPQTRSNKGQSPINADTFNLTGDLATLVDSLEVVVPITNQADGDTIASARASAGFAVSDARPLFAFNLATKALEYKGTSGWRNFSTPLGYMPESKIRQAVSANTSTLSVIENIPTFSFISGRRYKITWDCSYTQTVASDYFNLRIQTCSTADSSSATTGLTELIARPFSANSALAGQPAHIETVYVPGADATLQIKFTCERSVGSGSWQMEASKAFFTIEDVGARI